MTRRRFPHAPDMSHTKAVGFDLDFARRAVPEVSPLQVVQRVVDRRPIVLVEAEPDGARR
jgi:hypothetical protein